MAKRWTDRDIQILSDKIGLLSYSELSKKLGRSENAIKLYRARNNMPTLYDNFYSASMLAQELGKPRTTIRKYHRLGWLKGDHATWSNGIYKKPLMFIEQDIIAFLIEHRDLFNWRLVPNIYFRNIIKGEN